MKEKYRLPIYFGWEDMISDNLPPFLIFFSHYRILTPK